MKRAALYARYSSDSQRVESITAQLRRGREYCAAHELMIIKEYRDEAFSGTNTDRPGFLSMLDDAKRHLFDVLVVHKPDRFGRNEFDYYRNRAKLEQDGVELVFTGQQFDMSTPEGRLMENQLVGFAAFYSRNLANEVRKGQRENAYEGKSTNGALAYGYKTDKEKHIIIDEDRAPAIRQIFQMYADGHAYAEILAWLRAHGYKTARGNDFGKNSLHDILVNPRYIGTTVFGRNVPMKNGRRNNHRAIHDGCLVIEHAHEAIIDRPLWDKVAARMERNKNKGARFTAKHPYLLSGLIECGVCGAAMVGTTNRKSGTTKFKRYYRCNQRARKIAKTVCHNSLVPADDIERFVWQRIETVLTEPAFIDRIADRVRDAYASLGTNRKKQLAQLRPRRDKLRTQLDRLYDMVEDGAPDEFDRARIAKVKQALRTCEAELADAEQHPAVPLLTDEMIRTYVAKYLKTQKDGADNRRAVMEKLVEKVTVSPGSVAILYKVGFDWCDW